MPRREPLYPHIPKSRQRPVVSYPNLAATGARTRTDLRFLPDSPEEISYTTEAIGYRGKLEQAFTQAIARAKGMR